MGTILTILGAIALLAVIGTLGYFFRATLYTFFFPEEEVEEEKPKKDGHAAPAAAPTPPPPPTGTENYADRVRTFFTAIGIDLTPTELRDFIAWLEGTPEEDQLNPTQGWMREKIGEEIWDEASANDKFVCVHVLLDADLSPLDRQLLPDVVKRLRHAIEESRKVPPRRERHFAWWRLIGACVMAGSFAIMIGAMTTENPPSIQQPIKLPEVTEEKPAVMDQLPMANGDTVQEPPSFNTTSYTVQPEDTLSGIAKKLGVSAAELHAANIEQVPEPKKMKAGTILKVPQIAP